MTTSERILKEATSLKPFEQAQLVDNLLSLLDKPDSDLDKLWAVEVESRLDAYNKGKIKAISIEKVLAKYK